MSRLIFLTPARLRAYNSAIALSVPVGIPRHRFGNRDSAAKRASSETIAQTDSTADNPVEPFPDPRDGVGADHESSADVPVCAHPAVNEVHSVHFIDASKRWLIDDRVRPLERQSTACDEVDPASTGRAKEQASGNSELGEVVMPAAKDVFYSTTVNITFDNEVRGQMKGRPAAENRRPAVLRIGVPERGAADLAENNSPAVLRCYRDRDQESQAED